MHFFKPLFHLVNYLSNESKSLTIFDTGLYSSNLGTDGYDIYKEQSVAIRFFSNIESSEIQTIDILTMTNVFSEPYPSLNISISKGGENVPQFPKTLINTLKVNIDGWIPTVIIIKPESAIPIKRGEFYWIILESDNDLEKDALWNISDTPAFMSFSRCQNGKCEWQEGDFSSSACIKITSV